jgi:hypothetical protein
MNPDLNPQPEHPRKKKTELFDQAGLIEPAKRGAWKIMLPLTLLLLAMIYAAWTLGWHAQAVTAGVLLLAALSHALAWLLGIIALVPIIGPLVVKVLSLSIIWLLNAIGYLVSYIAIKRGYAKDVLTYRAITIALISGIVIGFVLGSLL